MRFQNRIDAGRRLATALARYRAEDPVILALPRGGVPVAAEVAMVLGAPLDLLLVRKIGVPGHAELAAGAVVDDLDPITVRNETIMAQAGVSEAAFERVRRAELAELGRRRAHYRGNRSPPDVAGRTVIVVDDGMATGATMRAALRALRRRNPRRLVLAVPVGQADTLADVGREADDAVCLEASRMFGGVSAFYVDFRQVPDAEVIGILACFDPAREPPTSNG